MNYIKKYYGKIILFACLLVVLLSACSRSDFQREIFTLDDLNGKTIIMWPGTGYEKYVEEKIPDGVIIYGDTIPYLCVNVRQGKADAAVMGRSFARAMGQEIEDLTALNESLGSVEGAFIFGNTDMGKNLEAPLNNFITKCWSDGTITELEDIWFTDNTEKQVIDYSILDDNTGETIVFGVSAEETPYTYEEGNTLLGYEIDLMVRFAEEHNYKLDMRVGSYFNLIIDANLGAYDIVGAGFEMISERKDLVHFSAPDRKDEVVVLVKDKEIFTLPENKISESIDRTFIHDDRYKDLFRGMSVTLFITLFSALFGTIGGFLLYYLNRNAGKVVHGIIQVLCTILDRIPTIVVLMILYYILFVNTPVSSTVVAVISFSLLFSVEVFETLSASVASVQPGQYEAAYTLGFERTETFFRIIMPQCMHSFLGNYKSSMIRLLLETSVVGYITIGDLTRAGDVIRNLSYDSFFPIFTVAAIYFILATIIIAIISLLEKKTDPRSRSREKIERDLTKN